MFIPFLDLLRRQLAQPSAALAAVHPALKRLVLVAAPPLAAYAAYLLALACAHPVMVAVPRPAAVHAGAMAPLARNRFRLAAYRAYLLAETFGQLKKMMVVALPSAALATAAPPPMADYSAKKGHRIHLGRFRYFIIAQARLARKA